MQAYYALPSPTRSATARRRSSSAASASPLPTHRSPLSPLTVDPAYSTIITDSPQSTSTSHVFPPTGIPPSTHPSPYLPRTPQGQRPHGIEDSLSQVDESGAEERDFPTVSQSSRAPLLAVKEKDFAEDQTDDVNQSRATRNVGHGRAAAERRDDSDSAASYIFVDPPDDPRQRTSSAGPSRTSGAPPSPTMVQPTKQRPVDPSYLPRPGPADAYISQFLTPITGPFGTQPPSPEPGDAPLPSLLRPPIPLRAASAPGVPLSALAASSPISPPQAEPEPAEGAQPLFRIFSAQLDVTAEEMVRRLKAHLGEVLKVQEEVGSMHLKLEGLGTQTGPGGGRDVDVNASVEMRKKEDRDRSGEGEGPDGPEVGGMVDSREKGVEEIMERLSSLSETLRLYHHLGTPKLSFPPTSKPSSAYPTSLASSPLTPAPPPIATSSPSSSTSRNPARRGPQSPTRLNTKVPTTLVRGDVRSATLGFEPLRSPTSPIHSQSKAQLRHAPKVHSNLDQVTTADEGEEDSEQGERSRSIGGNGNERGLMRAPDRKPGDVWLEGKKRDIGDGEGFTSSPMGMRDPTRPW